MREKRGLTQRKLAHDLGISQNYIPAIESGARKAGPKLRDQLVKYFGCSFDDLFEVDYAVKTRQPSLRRLRDADLRAKFTRVRRPSISRQPRGSTESLPCKCRHGLPGIRFADMPATCAVRIALGCRLHSSAAAITGGRVLSPSVSGGAAQRTRSGRLNSDRVLPPHSIYSAGLGNDQVDSSSVDQRDWNSPAANGGEAQPAPRRSTSRCQQCQPA